MKKILTIALLASTSSLFGQIEISSNESEVVKEEKESKSYETEVFGSVNWSTTGRILTENEGLFGDTLGERANETNLNAVSFAIGLRNKIKNNFFWEGGIAYVRNGEQYEFVGTDTLHQYTNTYAFIAMPLKIGYSYGSKYRVLASVGIVPQMFMRYYSEVKDVNSDGKETITETSTNSGYNPFVLSFVANLGGQIQLSDEFGLFVIGEYRQQLGSTFTNTSKFIHKGKALGFNIGFTIGL